MPRSFSLGRLAQSGLYFNADERLISNCFAIFSAWVLSAPNTLRKVAPAPLLLLVGSDLSIRSAATNSSSLVASRQDCSAS